MRVFALSLSILFVLACGGETEPAADLPAPEAVKSPPPVTEPAAVSVPGTHTIVGDSKLVKIVTAEWKPIEAYTQQFYRGELDELYALFSDAAKEEFSMQNLIDLHDKVQTDYGEEVEIVASRKEEKDEYVAFFRAARFSLDERLIEVAWVIGSDDSIRGLYITPDRSAQPDTP